MTAPRKLTQKQANFAAEYLLDFNGTQAALRAGYGARGAAVTALQLLRDPKIKRSIARRQRDLAAIQDVTQHRILREYARIAFSDLRQALTWGPEGVSVRASSELSDDEAAAIAEVIEDTVTTVSATGAETVRRRVRVKMHAKTAALQDLARHLGLFAADNAQQPAMVLPENVTFVFGNPTQAILSLPQANDPAADSLVRAQMDAGLLPSRSNLLSAPTDTPSSPLLSQ